MEHDDDDKIANYQNTLRNLHHAFECARDAGDAQVALVLADDAAWAFGEVWFRRFGSNEPAAWA